MGASLLIMNQIYQAAHLCVHNKVYPKHQDLIEKQQQQGHSRAAPEQSQTMTLGVQTHFSSHRLGPRFITTASLILMTILACAIRSDNQPLIYDPLSLSAIFFIPWNSVVQTLKTELFSLYL